MTLLRTLPVVLALLVLGTPAAAGAFGPAVPVEGTDGAAASGVALAPAPGNAVTAAWVRAADGAVRVRRIAADGTAGPVATVSAAPASGTVPALAATTGATLVGWVRAEDHHLIVRRLGDGGALGPEWDVSGFSLSETNGTAALAANAAGRVAAAWRRGNDSHVHLRAFDAQAGPSAPAVDLTAEPDIALFGTSVGVAVGADGGAVAVWHRNTDCHIIARRVGPGGAPAAQVDVSGEPDSAVGDTNPTVRVDPAGGAVLAWHRDRDGHAVVRRWGPDGSLGPFADLSGAAVPTLANLALTAGPEGTGLAWQRAGDRHVVVAGADGPVDVSLAPTAAGTAPATAITAGGLAVGWRADAGGLRVAFAAGAGAGSGDPGAGGGDPATAGGDPAGGGTTTTTPTPTHDGRNPILPTQAGQNRVSAVGVGRTAALRGRTLRVSLRCPAGARPCRGRLAARVGALTAARTFRVPAGRARILALRLPRAPAARRVTLTVRQDGRPAQRRTVPLRHPPKP